MMNEQPAELRRSIRVAWHPLGELAGGRLAFALDGVEALAIDRATRDRLVIFDPASSHLIRPLVSARDIAPWHAAATGRWMVAVPRTEAASVARYTLLARHLAALPAPTVTQGAPEPWWALPDATPPPAPRIIVTGDPPVVAWDESVALVSGPATVIAAAEPYWLALLGSELGRTLLQAPGGVAAFPIPEVPRPAAANLAGLALSAAILATQIDELERAVLKRLVADFGPPGVAPGLGLRRWWMLSFDELDAAVRAELRNDIPERYRPTWAQIHADECDTHRRAITRLREIEKSIDLHVYAGYGWGQEPDSGAGC